MKSWFLFTNPANKASRLLVYHTKNSNWSLLRLRPLSTSTVYQNSSATTASSTTSEKPPQEPKKSKGSSSFKVFAFAITGFTIGLGYATLNPDSRAQIESHIPQFRYVFDFLDGLIKSEPSIKLPPVDAYKTNEKAVQESFLQVINSTIPKASNTQTSSQQQEPSKLKKIPATASEPSKLTSLEPPVSKPSENKNDWKNTLKQFELQQEATVDAIEHKLTNLTAEAKLKVSEALNSSYVAIESLNKYRAALRQALDENKDNDSKEMQWRQVTNLFETQTADVNEANLKFALARKTIEDLDLFLKEAKSSELVKNIKNIRETQNNLIDEFRKLQAEQNKLAETVIHANVLKSYTSEQKIARNQFLKEIQSLQPEGITRTSGDNLSNEEINSLLIHAHKRVLQLQKQIEKLQLTQNQQVQAALEEQRKQSASLLKTYEANFYELHKKEFDLEKDKIIESEKVKADEELKKELSRQAAAHNNHLAQMLKIQQDELTSLYEKKLLIESEKVRNEFYHQVSGSLGRLIGIESALNARANLELQANNAKQLWLAIQNLNEIISSRADEVSLNKELVEIKASIETIKQSAPDNEFIQKLVNTIPEKALNNGVWSEPDLKDRFYRLRKICNKVALIDERGGSLFKYAISYIQSFFILSTKIDKARLDNNNQQAYLNDINLSNTFRILDYSEYYIENNDFESALKLLQQLKGEPLRLARDWISDALLLIEIKQACNLLTAYISSVYIGTEFK